MGRSFERLDGSWEGALRVCAGGLRLEVRSQAQIPPSAVATVTARCANARSKARAEVAARDDDDDDEIDWDDAPGPCDDEDDMPEDYSNEDD